MSRLGIAVRVLLVTILIGLLFFALGLFFGIVGIVVANLFRSTPIALSGAYRMIAFPLGICGLVAGLGAMLRWEIREARKRQLPAMR